MKRENDRRETLDRVETESLSRMKRKNVSRNKKTAALKTLREKGLIEREKKSRDWTSLRTSYWRHFREQNETTVLENSDSGDKDIEDIIENSEKVIGEIGLKLQVKLKETILKTKFSDLDQSDFMKTNISEVKDDLKSYLAMNSEPITT